VYSAGSAVSWLEELSLIGGAADLDRVGGTSGEEAVFVPSLAGLGAPFWAPEARGGWLGLSLATRRDDLVRAVVWGIAAQVASLARAMGEDMGRPLERLRVDGGLTRSKALMQAQADLLQVPVERYPSADATALGVAALARLGSGLAGTPEDAVGDWVPAELFEPRMAADEAQERLQRWEAAAAALAELSR
jgi:glycerol kinase